MARDATLRRRRRGIDVDDVLPLLIPAIALLTTTTRRRDPIINYDAWHTCVLEGCATLVGLRRDLARVLVNPDFTDIGWIESKVTEFAIDKIPLCK